jgi:cytochrome c-type biogenesis protein CcmF
VFLGTLYPLFLEAVGGGKVSVGPPYFNATFVPLMLPLIAALGVGPMLAWKRADLKGALQRLKVAFVVTAVVFVVCAYVLWGRSVFGMLGLALAAWLGTAVVIEFAERLGAGKGVGPAGWWRRAQTMPRASYGMMIAHLGVAVSIVGMTASTLWETERITVMEPGQTETVAGYDFTFEGAGPITGPNYRATEGTFVVASGGERIATLTPEKREYTVSGRTTTEASIRTRPLGDLFAVIGDPQPDQAGAYTVRLYFKPMVAWIWFGAGLMGLGGLVSLSDRRLRVGAPTRARRRGAAPQPALGAAKAER